MEARIQPHAQRAQKNRRQEFALADPHVEQVLLVVFKLDPGAAVRNDLGNKSAPRLKKTPGERCNCETITRSVPLMMNVPLSVINGISPKKTSSSLISRIDFTFVSGSLS